MPTRLHLIFDGGPDDEEHRLREVADDQNRPLIFGHLARWIPVSKPQNIWALKIDTVSLDRRPVVALIAPRRTETVDRIAAELGDNGSIVLQRTRDLVDVLADGEETARKDRTLQRARIEMADRVFVVNDPLDDLDPNEANALDDEAGYARIIGRQVQYFRYDQVDAVTSKT